MNQNMGYTNDYSSCGFSKFVDGSKFKYDEDGEICLDIAQRLEGRLIALGVTVVLTRGPKNNPSESERINSANNCGADLIISLHTDKYKNEKATGLWKQYYESGN